MKKPQLRINLLEKTLKMENRISVLTTKSEHEAIIVQGHLKAEGIDALVLDLKDHVTEVQGTFEVHVLIEDEDKAKTIIQSSKD